MIHLWNTFLYWLMEKLEPRLFGAQRSGLWPTVRRNYIEKNPECAVCSTTKDCEVHHRIPVHVDKTMELRESNLVTLCRADHYLFGHLNSWYSYNKEVVFDAEMFKSKIKLRP